MAASGLDCFSIYIGISLDSNHRGLHLPLPSQMMYTVVPFVIQKNELRIIIPFSMHCIALTVPLFYHFTLLEKELENQHQKENQHQEGNHHQKEKRGDSDNRDTMIETSMYAEFPGLLRWKEFLLT